MNAPDRIWAGPRGAYWSTEDIGVGTDTEYVRADIAADLLAALEALEHEYGPTTLRRARAAIARARGAS